MISHGTQEITDLRRGTWQITSMTRGTFDIFHAPYSREATEALKAAFPTQWETIRQYGFAHPALVPFVNDDPMLVMSLIEGLGTRWLQGNQSAYIITPYTANGNTEVKCKFLAPTDGLPVFYCRQSDGNRMYRFVQSSATRNWACGYGSGTTQYNVPVPANEWHTIEYKSDSGKMNIYLDGVYKNYWNVQSFTTPKAMAIMAGVWAGSSYEARAFAYISELKFAEGGIDLYDFVPCKHIVNGNLEVGMLDIVNLVFYPKTAGSGSFTISETPANQPS